ncbi:2-oxoacid:acceptor oxidoreductase family protein [Filifactor villosus]|uniref:2-oxoacid:acceptor oxidoreductase family protein n=1 Tax=Filifactor villosus TaxID=29374 RepID=A0ABV9QJ67_9FIRM
MMEHKIIMAGFGGQGVMAIGQLTTYAGMVEDKFVSWLPSYGPEMRGGTANCAVIISDEPVSAPTVTQSTSAIIMNEPSLEKFEPEAKPGAKFIINSSLVFKKIEREDIEGFYIPANEIAAQIGNPKVANMVMLGAFLEATHVVSEETVLKVFTKVFGANKEKFIPMNKEAMEAGANYVKNQK